MKLKSLTLAMLLSAFAGTAFAQAPTVTAPKPQVDASLVGSCFSDAYESSYQFTPVEGKYKGAFKTVEIAPGDYVLKMDEFTYAHFGIGSEDGATAVDLSGYDRVHFDIFKPADSQFNNAIQPGLAGSTTTYSGEQNLKLGEWVSVDIKMADFNGSGLGAIKTMLLKDKSNNTKGTLYVDNVFFYKGDPVASLPGDPIDPDFQGEGDEDDEPVDPTAPTVSAPVPTIDAEQVKSAFSDAYTSFAKWDYAGYGSKMTTLTINGNDHITKFDGGWAAVSVGDRNVADMEYFHADVYTPADNGITSIRIGFSLWSGGEKYAEEYVTNTPGGEWTSVDIPLSAFNGYNFATMQVMRMTVTGSGPYFLDNVYFYTTKVAENTLPTVAAPVPQYDAANVGSAFSDKYDAKFNFDGYNKRGGTEVIVREIANGENVLEIKNFNWIHFALGEVAGETTVDLSGYENLHFDVYIPNNQANPTTIQPGMYNVAAGAEGFHGAQNLKAGQWASFDLPVAGFAKSGLSTSAVNNLTFKGGDGSGVIYLDNVFFYNGEKIDPQPGEPDEPETPKFTILPAPAPINAAADVKSVYSNAYTPFANLKYDGGNGTIEFEEINVNGDDMYKFANFNYVKLPPEDGAIDVSDMTYMHIDVAVPSSGGIPKIMPVLVSGNNSYYTGTYDLVPGKWNSLNIKLADFTAKGLDATQLGDIRFKHNGSASDDGDVILDNIYFSKEIGTTGTIDNEWGSAQGDTPGGGSDLNIPFAPAPNHDAADVKAFFSDAYPVLFGKFEIPTNAEYDKNGLIEIIDQAEGQQVAKITNLNWRVVNLGQRDVSDKGYLHVDYYSPEEDGVTSVCINLTNWDTKNGSAFELDGDAQNYRTLTPGQWTSFDIPLNNFHSSDPTREFNFATDMACVRFYAGDGSRGKTLYVDNFYFWGEPQEDEGGDDEVYEPIQDSSDGELPDMNTPMLGVNLSSASGGAIPGVLGTAYIYPKNEDLYYFKAKGVRLIRLPFRAARVVEDITKPTEVDTQDLNELKRVVAEAERLGMWVFLDAHDYAERTTNGTQDLLGNGEYTYERFGKMWGAIAAEFAGYKNIWGYDLQNEPKVTAQVLLQGYQAAIDEIRKVDTKANIIVEGTNWASAYEWIYGDRSDKSYPEYSNEVAWSYKVSSPWLLATLNDPQNKIVYEAHGYFDQDNSGTYTKGFQNVDYRKRFLPFLEWCRTNNVTGLIGEFGVPYNEHSTGDPRYMDVLDGALQLFREYQVHATYWCAGAMYEGNSLTCQPDKSPLYGNYAKEKSTMGVLEKYFTNWANEDDAVDNIAVDEAVEGDGRIYNIMGIEVDENYKGFVIKNGKKILQK